MDQPIEITRTELSVSELRALAVKIRDGAVVRRLLANALLLEGHSREASARANGMTRQTPRDWVHRYDADSAQDCIPGPDPGRPALLSDDQPAMIRMSG